MQLIDNARHWWRLTSIQLNIFALACDGAFIGVAATVARMYKQRLPE